MTFNQTPLYSFFFTQVQPSIFTSHTLIILESHTWNDKMNEQYNDKE